MKTSMIFGLNILLGAFLVFFIQPTSAKHLLPQYGGSAFVWIACVLFFQISLFGGYLYAYLLDKCFRLPTQAIIHLIFLLAAFWFMPIQIMPLTSTTISSPAFQIIGSLIDSLFIPLLLVCASSPLLQHWYCQLTKTRYPYRFYALSNTGSFIGLLGFPLLLELWLDIPSQFKLWSWIFVFFGLLSVLCSLMILRMKAAPKTPLEHLPISVWAMLHWIGLAFLGSALLVASTFYITQNLINMPLLWVGPLALYLISFIISFSDPKPIKQSFWHKNYMLWLILFSWMLVGHHLNGFDVIVVLFALMFSGMMVAHSHLYLARPHHHHLTLFYLMVALGGMLGGLFVNLVTMLSISHWLDLYLPLIAISVITLRFAIQGYKKEQTIWQLITVSFAGFMAPFFVVAISLHITQASKHEIFRHRNFYGIISVTEEDPQKDTHFRQLRHGSIVHGFQFLNPKMVSMPTAYYTPQSGVGAALEFLHQQKGPIAIGAIGLGTGTIAALAQKGDTMDFYEIDNDVITAGQTYFSFIRQSPARIQIYEGDGRLALAALAEQTQTPIYDLIVIDAFSGDTIPFHLITQEALAIYLKLLKPNGIIAFHISNIYLNLAHVTHSLAQNSWLQHYWIIAPSTPRQGAFASDWTLLTKNKQMKGWLEHKDYLLSSNRALKKVYWTDENNSLLPILRLSLN